MNFSYKASNNNISRSEFLSLKKFISDKPFKISSCDKNIGVAIISNNIHKDLCNLHLDNLDNFQKLVENPLNATQKIIENKLIELKVNKNISPKLFNVLLVKNPKLGTFNILPKLHKNKFGTRPIINCINHPTSVLSHFIDLVLQPFILSSSTYIKDSQNLIQKLESFKFVNDIKLSSFDFESLYSNINLEDALHVISSFMVNKISNPFFDYISFINIIKLVFFNNVFVCYDNYYRQVKGIAMGSKCGPSIANIYLFILEKDFLTIHKPLFYGRYIDDIFCILDKDFNTNLLIDHFGYLKLNEVSSNSVNFLDLIISFDPITKLIKFSLYIKPTNTILIFFLILITQIS